MAEKKNNLKVGDKIDTLGHTNMKGVITVRKIEARTVYFTDEDGTDYQGFSHATARRLLAAGEWKMISEKEEKPNKEGKKESKEMNKIVHIGQIPEYGNRYHDIFCKIEIDKKGELHINGVVGPRKNGNAAGSAGQIDGDLKKRIGEIKFVKGWNDDKLRGFLNIWENWHLNFMHAGDEHQRALGWEKDGYDRHPSEACPVDGYKFGSEWKRVELPSCVIEVLETFPETDKKPAWV